MMTDPSSCPGHCWENVHICLTCCHCGEKNRYLMGQEAGKRLRELAEKTSLGLRPELEAFARSMEAVLKENDHKGGWDGHTLKQLINRVFDEARELDRAANAEVYDEEEVKKEAIDTANFCMMVFDIISEAQRRRSGMS